MPGPGPQGAWQRMVDVLGDARSIAHRSQGGGGGLGEHRRSQVASSTPPIGQVSGADLIMSDQVPISGLGSADVTLNLSRYRGIAQITAWVIGGDGTWIQLTGSIPWGTAPVTPSGRASASYGVPAGSQVSVAMISDCTTGWFQALAWAPA